jgi:pentatricopeptide repeat protein
MRRYALHRSAPRLLLLGSPGAAKSLSLPFPSRSLSASSQRPKWQAKHGQNGDKYGQNRDQNGDKTSKSLGKLSAVLGFDCDAEEEKLRRLLAAKTRGRGPADKQFWQMCDAVDSASKESPKELQESGFGGTPDVSQPLHNRRGKVWPPPFLASRLLAVHAHRSDVVRARRVFEWALRCNIADTRMLNNMVVAHNNAGEIAAGRKLAQEFRALTLAAKREQKMTKRKPADEDSESATAGRADVARCRSLYVGNLPHDTAERELRELLSRTTDSDGTPVTIESITMGGEGKRHAFLNFENHAQAAAVIAQHSGSASVRGRKLRLDFDVGKDEKEAFYSDQYFIPWDRITYNLLIHGCRVDVDEAYKYFDELVEEFGADDSSISAVVSAVAFTGDGERAVSEMETLAKRHSIARLPSRCLNYALAAFAVRGDAGRIRELIRRPPAGSAVDEVAYSELMRALMLNGEIDEAVKVLRDLRTAQLPLPDGSLKSLVDALCSRGRLALAETTVDVVMNDPVLSTRLTENDAKLCRSFISRARIAQSQRSAAPHGMSVAPDVDGGEY